MYQIIAEDKLLDPGFYEVKELNKDFIILIKIEKEIDYPDLNFITNVQYSDSFEINEYSYKNNPFSFSILIFKLIKKLNNLYFDIHKIEKAIHKNPYSITVFCPSSEDNLKISYNLDGYTHNAYIAPFRGPKEK